jgi:hypothetical protein
MLLGVLFIATVLLLLEGCGHVTIQDETIWALKPQGLGAFEAHTLSAPTADLTEDQFQALRAASPPAPLVCMSATSFGDYKSALEIFCSDYPQSCSYATVYQMKNFFTKMSKLIEKAKVKP